MSHDQRHPDISACVTTMELIEQCAKQTAAWQNAADRRWNETRALDQVFIAV